MASTVETASVQRAEKSSKLELIELRKTIRNKVQESLEHDSRTIVSHPIKDPENRTLTLSWLKPSRDKFSESSSEPVKVVLSPDQLTVTTSAGGSIKLSSDDAVFEGNLGPNGAYVDYMTGEKAIRRIAKSIGNFLPPKR
jgi:hypothetical protein